MSNTNISALTRRTYEKGELGRHTNIPALTRRTSEKSEIATEPSKSKIVIEKGEVATDPNIPALTPRKSKTVRFERGELAKDTFENGELADYFSNRTPKLTRSRTPKLSRKSKRNRTAKLSRRPNPEPTFLSFPEQNSIFSTTHCLRYYNESDYANYLLDSCCKGYEECNNLEEELESAKFKCNRFLKRKNITGFETDEIGNVTDINSQCGLLHHRISEIKATKNSFVHRPREILDFIDKSQGKSDNINNDNKYGIIFKDGKIKNMNDIYIYRNRSSHPTTLRMLLLDQKINRSKISFGVNDLFVGVGKKQTRRKSNKKTNKKKSNKKKSNK